MGQAKRNRTKDLQIMQTRRRVAQYAQVCTEQYNFDRLVKRGVIVPEQGILVPVKIVRGRK